MHRVTSSLIMISVFLAACDPGANSTFRLTPSRTQPRDMALSATDAGGAEALAAAERVVLAFGLEPVPGGLGEGCRRGWRLGGDRRTDHPRGGGADLVVCARWRLGPRVSKLMSAKSGVGARAAQSSGRRSPIHWPASEASRQSRDRELCPSHLTIAEADKAPVLIARCARHYEACFAA